VGYGLTETSPVTNVRRPWHNLEAHLGSRFQVQKFALLTSKLVSPTCWSRSHFSAGTTDYAGYYQNPEMTAKAIDPEGWFNTGDLGWVTLENDLVRRAKDTLY